MSGDTATVLLALGSNPWAIAFAIVAATFILEDATTIGAALLAAGEIIAPSTALTALIVGIFLGDLGLYGLGAAARTRPWARRMIGERHMVKGRLWLKRHFFTAVIGARFLPGFRMPAYTASGFLGLPILKFTALVAFAGVVWTTLVFSLVFHFGQMIVEDLGVWRWAVIALLLALSFGAPMLAERVVARTARPGDDHHV